MIAQIENGQAVRQSDGYLERMNNEDLLSHIRHLCKDKAAADLLKQRWESFWDNDYKTLQRQRFDIERLIRNNAKDQEDNLKLSKEIKELESLLEEYEGGRKIKALRAQVQRLHKSVARLTNERQRLKKGLPLPPKEKAPPTDDLWREIERLEKRLAKVTKDLIESRQRNFEYLIGGKAKPNGRDAIQIVPPFEVHDHPKFPVKSTTVANAVRILAT